MSKHWHRWEVSTNRKCPHCGGIMELCAHGDCRLYRCQDTKIKYVLTENGWLEEADIERRLP